MSETLIQEPRWWRPLAKADRRALWLLLAVPTLLFVVPALFGHPAIDSDNLIQNFPLRVLVGRQLDTGHLPLLDPYTNAGTPLLGGMNAGALYPLTLIFAFLPAIPAWLINMIAIYVTASLGVFVLLRWHGLSTWPAAAAGLSYAYAGAMIGQMIHLGVVQGYSFVPWATVLVLALSRRFERLGEAGWRAYARVAPRWIVGVALLWGLTFLTGEPRAIAVIELLTLVLVPGVLLLRSSYWLSSWRARIAFLLTLGVGFLWGLGLGLIQLLPGWSYITFSQRSQVTYWFFGAGSLPVRWTWLLLSPDLFGGNGNYGQQGWFANYNLAEVTGYAGILALMAGCAFFTRLTRRGWRGAHRDYVLYVVLAVVGLFAAWGNFTPVGHLFRAIPLFGSTRLQSRNVIVVDFALAVFLGWWFEQLRHREPRAAGLGSRARWLTSLPALGLAAVSVALLVNARWTVAKLAPGVPGAPLASGLHLIDVVYLVVAVLALTMVWVFRHSRYLFRGVLIVLVLDLALFSTFSATGLIGGPGAREASRSEAVSLLGTTGRFALVDVAGVHTGVYRAIGLPNMNVWTRLSSVQGYGSLISTIYDDATGTHPEAALNPCHLAAGTFTPLRLSTVAITSEALSTRTTVPRAKLAPDCVPTPTANSTARYFGQLLKIDSVHLTFENSPSLLSVSVRALNARGVPFGPTITQRGNSYDVFDFPGEPLAAGFTIHSSGATKIADAVVYPHGSPGVGFSLNNAFQLAIDSSHWRLASTEDTFSVFKATSLLPRAWLLTPSAGRVTKVTNASWGDTWIDARATATTTLVRSEAYLPGWRATALNLRTGRSVALPISRYKLVQSVRLPPGDWRVHYHYHAPYIEVSSAVSAVAWLLVLGAGGLFAVRRRRRASGKVRT